MAIRRIMPRTKRKRMDIKEYTLMLIKTRISHLLGLFGGYGTTTRFEPGIFSSHWPTLHSRSPLAIETLRSLMTLRTSPSPNTMYGSCRAKCDDCDICVEQLY